MTTKRVRRKNSTQFHPELLKTSRITVLSSELQTTALALLHAYVRRTAATNPTALDLVRPTDHLAQLRSDAWDALAGADDVSEAMFKTLVFDFGMSRMLDEIAKSAGASNLSLNTLLEAAQRDWCRRFHRKDHTGDVPTGDTMAELDVLFERGVKPFVARTPAAQALELHPEHALLRDALNPLFAHADIVQAAPHAAVVPAWATATPDGAALYAVWSQTFVDLSAVFDTSGAASALWTWLVEPLRRMVFSFGAPVGQPAEPFPWWLWSRVARSVFPALGTRVTAIDKYPHLELAQRRDPGALGLGSGPTWERFEVALHVLENLKHAGALGFFAPDDPLSGFLGLGPDALVTGRRIAVSIDAMLVRQDRMPLPNPTLPVETYLWCRQNVPTLEDLPGHVGDALRNTARYVVKHHAQALAQVPAPLPVARPTTL